MRPLQGTSSRQLFLLVHVYIFSVVCLALYFRSFLLNPSTCVPAVPKLTPAAFGQGFLSDSIRTGLDDSKCASNAARVSVKSVMAEDIVKSMVSVHPDDYLAKNESFFVPRDHVVNPLDPGWLLQPSPCPQDGPALLVVIPSVDGDRGRRRAIRETWASPAYGHSWPGHAGPWARHTVKVLFFLAVSKTSSPQVVAEEASVHGDIARGNFSDTYGNLSLKMSAVLAWVSDYCSGARHVIKVDQDTFVHLPLLLDVLALLSTERSRFVLGHQHMSTRPLVSRRKWWTVSEEVYPFTAFPRYLYGHSYVISGDAVQPLRHASQRMPLVPNEDAYVTGVLAKSANVSRLHTARMASVLDFDRCALVKGTYISQTWFKDNTSLYKTWDMLKSGYCSTA